MTLPTPRARRQERRRRELADRRRRDEFRPDPSIRRLDSFGRLEVLDEPRPVTSPGTRPTPVPLPENDAASIWTPATRRAPVVELDLRRRRRVRTAVVFSAVGSLGTGLFAVGPVAATPLPESPTPVVERAPLAPSAITGLEQGRRGDDVRQLQQALLSAGIAVRGGADGVFGPATRASLEQFQAAKGLPVTGRVDVATAEALAASAGSSTPAAPGSGSPGDYVGLSRGASGPLVSDLQRALVDAGAWLPSIDGTFDASTERALRQFQTWNGLGVTGTVTQAVVNRLRLGSSSGSGGDASSGVTTSSGTSSGTGASTATPSASGHVGLARGARGPLVADLQRALMNAGITVIGGADGVFGVRTEQALVNFQRARGLGESTTVTEQVAGALGLSGAAPAPAPAPEAPPSGSASGYVGLARGARGPLVADLQRALMERGIPVPGGADGVFGPKTQAALVAFQRANGLSPTGVVAAGDVSALGLSGEEPVAPPAGEQFVGLAKGARGSAVRELQQALMDAGVTVRGGADGVFGSMTEAALREYQRAKGLTASGVVDQATVDALGLGSDAGPQPVAPPPAPVTPPAGPVGEESPPEASDSPYVGLGVGARGPLVAELQRALIAQGLVLRGGADGVFGPATAATLKAFQAVNGIPQTGVVTARGAQLLGLGTGQHSSGGGAAPSVQLVRFPVQGRCFFGDTWHAPRSGGRLHEGTDIIADEGKLLYAVVDGTISKLYWDQPGALSGNGLRISQDDGTYFTYLHMLGFAPGIQVGTKVRAGDVIGWVGNTGSSATPHLHFEIHPGGGAAINPYSYLRAIDDCSNETPRHQSSFAPG